VDRVLPAGGEAGELDVEISVVNHRNRDLLRTCLRALEPACRGLTWHVTVIDNASGDGSLEMLAEEFGNVGVIANEVPLGFGANHNQVLRPLIAQRTARHALVLNDDTELRPDAVTQMVRMLDGVPGLGAVVPTIIDLEGRVAANRLAYPTPWSALRCDLTDRTEPADPDHGFLQGCCVLVRVEAIARAGPFDERFFLFYEDTDLSRRLVDAGWSLGVCAGATVVHVGHVSVLRPDMVRITPQQGLRSRYLYLAKHRGRPQAEAVSALGRLVLLARAGRVTVRSWLADDPDRRVKAARLRGLALLNPRRPLAPELRATGTPARRRRLGRAAYGRARSTARQGPSSAPRRSSR